MKNAHVWHAIEMKGAIAVLRIAQADTIRAFAFRTSGNQCTQQEYEVLVQSGLRLVRTRTQNIMTIQVVEYDVSLC